MFGYNYYGTSACQSGQKLSDLLPPPVDTPKVRRRRVWDTDKVLSLWAKQEQSEASNRQHNLFFVGPDLYSYRTSFLAATLVTRSGVKIALVNSDTYSATTRGHIYGAIDAAIHAGLRVVAVPLNREGAMAAYLTYLQGEIDTARDRAKRARSNKQSWIDLAGKCEADADFLADFFGLPHIVGNASPV